MASAVLANRNEPNWPPQQPRGGGGGAAGGGFMGKVPFSSSNTHRNPNPNKRQFKSEHHHHAATDFNNGSPPPAVTQTASDDASSINHHRRSNDVVNLAAAQSQYVSFNIAAYSKKELAELKNQLLSELDQIRVLKARIEAGDFIPKTKKLIPGGNNKKISGSKRPFPIGKESNFNSKRSHLESNGNLIKNCGQILSKLMKHKHPWIFNKPVDVVRLGLHDYNDIIKKPMDLGTVKMNLAKGLYSTPFDFASDVRLTFENAMRYNPPGHEVYAYADQLRLRFEELFQPLNEKPGDGFPPEKGFDEELQASSWNHVEPERVQHVRRETPVRVEKKVVEPVRAPPLPIQTPASSSNPSSNPALGQSSPVRTNSQMKGSGGKPLKQPKPKAKDPNKREMSMEEKHKLGLGLQSLPQEKMEQVVQIIKKRKGHLKQDGDEIELDIEAVDTETLWELDRLVTNWKKMVSKIKRQSLLGNPMNSNSNSNIASNRGHGELPGSEKAVGAMVEPKRAKKGGEVGDEDVDIGDDMPMSSFPPVEIEKDVGGGGGGHASSDSSSSSSSSSSGSSSSSDSDSGSSSGSDSDDDNAQS